MKYLLAVMAMFYALTYLSHRAADHAGDDFGAGVLFWLCAAISVLLTIAYFSFALWLGRLY